MSRTGEECASNCGARPTPIEANSITSLCGRLMRVRSDESGRSLLVVYGDRELTMAINDANVTTSSTRDIQ